MVAVDQDRGLSKVIKEVFGTKKPENLDYFLAKKWGRIREAVDHAFGILGPGDWMVFDMVGGMWDHAQSEYSRRVYGEDLSAHLMALRAEAQEAIAAAGGSLRSQDENKRKEAQKVVSTQMQYSGLEGRTDWALIKRMHNDDIFDYVVREGDFNVLATTSLTPVADDELQKHKWPDFEVIGRRPEGEKHNIHRFDTYAHVERINDKFLWRTNLGMGKGKDRSHKLYRDIDFTDVGFVTSRAATIEENE